MRKSEEKYRTFLEDMPGVYYRIDKEGNFKMINTAGIKLFGYDSLKDIQKKNISKGFYLNLEDRDKYLKELEKNKGYLKDYEIILKKKDGTPLVVSDTSCFYYDEEGNIAGIEGNFIDITDRVKIRQELQKSKENYQLLLENQTDLVVKVDTEGRFLFVSPSYCETFGKTEKELLGNRFTPLVHKDEQEATVKSMENLYAPPYTCYIEQRAKTKNGWKWLSWANKSILDKGGKIVAIVGVGRDITERKQNEKVQQVLYNISRSANSNISIKELYPIIHKELQKIIDATNFHISLFSENKTVFSYYKDEKDDFTQIHKLGTTDNLATYVSKSSKSILVNYKQIMDMVSQGKIKLSQLGTLTENVVWLGVSLKIKDSVIGSMAVLSYTNPHLYSEKDIKLMEFVSSQIATAIERKKTEEALQTSQQEFYSLFKNISEALVYIDNKGTILYINPRFTKVFGYTLEEIKGKNLDEGIIHSPKMIDEGEKLTKKALKGFVNYETIRKRKNGSEFPVFISSAPVKINNQLKGIITLYQDITERKKTEEELRQSEEKFSSIFKNIPDAAFYQDTEGFVLDINPRFTEVFGYTKKDIVGKHIDKIGFYPKDKVKEGISLSRKTINKDLINFETVRQKKDGTPVPVNISTSYVKIKDRFMGIIALYQDITKRKQTEKVLRESEERFRALIESSSDIIQVVDLKGILRYLSPSIQRILGYRPEELIGKPSMDIVHPDDLPIVIEGFKKILQRPEKPLITVCRCKHKNGTWRVLEGTSVNYLNNPVIQGLVSNTRDITERKRSEKLNIVLYNISKAANSPISLEQLYPLIHQELGKIIDTTNFYIALVDKNKDELYFPYYIDERDVKLPFMKFSTTNTLTTYVIKTGKSLLNDNEQYKEMIAQGILTPMGSTSDESIWLGVPLKIKGKVIGAMVVQSYANPNLYSKKDIKIMEFVSEQVATAIERKKMEEELRKLAHHDFLTKTFNRAYGLELLQRQIKLAKRNKTSFLVAYTDLDNLKDINDEFGHEEGDKAITQTAKLFQSILREVDIIIRMGGDEFLLVFPNSSAREIPVIKKRLYDKLDRQNLVSAKPYKTGFSIGISCYDPDNPQSIDELIRIADQNMYLDKKKRKK